MLTLFVDKVNEAIEGTCPELVAHWQVSSLDYVVARRLWGICVSPPIIMYAWHYVSVLSGVKIRNKGQSLLES